VKPFLNQVEDGVRNTKRAIRSQTLMDRTTMSQSLHATLCTQMAETFWQWLHMHLPKPKQVDGEPPVIGLYSAIRSEPNLFALHTRLVQAGWRVAYPRIEQGHLVYYDVVNLADLQRGSFQILEPTPNRSVRVPASALTLLCIPGVAFSLEGFRLGYGGGYFDKLLADDTVDAIRMGVTFFAQCIPHLPVEPHDLPMHYLLTEATVMACPNPPCKEE
jgi:5-formyltetrahydrofolate cyclo-ligase